jgi:hypothetical protein
MLLSCSSKYAFPPAIYKGKDYNSHTVYKTVILLVALYGCETWSLTLGKGADWGNLRTWFWGRYMNRGMKGQKAGENYMSSSPNIFTTIKSKRVGWATRVPRMGDFRFAYKILVGKSEATLTWAQSRASSMWSRRLTAWVTARPSCVYIYG